MKKMEEPRKNPLSKEVEVDGVMTAGKDFPAGTYDVVAVSMVVNSNLLMNKIRMTNLVQIVFGSQKIQRGKIQKNL